MGLLPLAAQLPAPVQHCAHLRHHGDPGTQQCYQKLTLVKDPVIQAEGFWGIHDYKTANDWFKAAIKLHPDNPNLRVRWGLLYLDHWQAAEAEKLFQEALAIQKDNAGALLGMAMIAMDSFEAKATT